jgi:hypothetical protein
MHSIKFSLMCTTNSYYYFQIAEAVLACMLLATALALQPHVHELNTALDLWLCVCVCVHGKRCRVE